jgi:hypothetical protein
VVSELYGSYNNKFDKLRADLDLILIKIHLFLNENGFWVFLIDLKLILWLKFKIPRIKVVPNQFRIKTWLRSFKSTNFWKSEIKITVFQSVTVFQTWNGRTWNLVGEPEQFWANLSRFWSNLSCFWANLEFQSWIFHFRVTFSTFDWSGGQTWKTTGRT